MVWTGSGNLILAPSLVALYDQADARFPDRSIASDGTIGDAAHADRVSDHNPAPYTDGKSYVTAADLTDWDPRFDVDEMLENLRQERDPRIKYGISDGRFFSSYATPDRAAWAWAPYNGLNGHFKHVHISVLMSDVGLFDTSSWFPAKPPVYVPPIKESSSMLDVIEITDQVDKWFITAPDGVVRITPEQAYAYVMGNCPVRKMTTANFNHWTNGPRARNFNDAPTME